MHKRQIDYRREYKHQAEYVDTLLFFHAGNFTRTFETDARFLSAKFAMQINQFSEYQMVGFPIDSEEKYLSTLDLEGYGYQVCEVKDWVLQIVVKNIWNKPLLYNEEQLRFAPHKLVPWGQKQQKHAEIDMKGFLQDLQVLIGKYLSCHPEA